MIKSPKELAQQIYATFSTKINQLFVDSVASDNTKFNLKLAVEQIILDLIPKERRAEYFMEVSVSILEPSPGKYSYIPDNMLTGLLLSFVPFDIAILHMSEKQCAIDGIKYELRHNGILVTFPDNISKGE